MGQRPPPLHHEEPPPAPHVTPNAGQLVNLALECAPDHCEDPIEKVLIIEFNAVTSEPVDTTYIVI